MLLSCVVLAITMDSLMLPLLFIASIGMAILYNLGTNVFAGEISYITMALAAVLQLGVTDGLLHLPVAQLLGESAIL